MLQHAIPAARRAGIRIIWLNWGLTDDDLQSMPPATFRAFGFSTVAAEAFDQHARVAALDATAAIDSHGVNELAPQIAMAAQHRNDTTPTIEAGGKNARIYRGLGSDIGAVDGGQEGGRLLFRDTWNAALTPELQASYETEGLSARVPDVWMHKNRMSGLWGASTECAEFIEREGLRTLLFAGVNTDVRCLPFLPFLVVIMILSLRLSSSFPVCVFSFLEKIVLTRVFWRSNQQCVAGSLQDAFTRGYDCILLSDGCGTTSPPSSQESIEFNCAKTWGFCSTCNDLDEAVKGMETGPTAAATG